MSASSGSTETPSGGSSNESPTVFRVTSSSVGTRAEKPGSREAQSVGYSQRPGRNSGRLQELRAIHRGEGGGCPDRWGSESCRALARGRTRGSLPLSPHLVVVTHPGDAIPRTS